MKQGPGPDMAILGSGSIVAQLADEGLIDEFQSWSIPSCWAAGARCSTAFVRR